MKCQHQNVRQGQAYGYSAPVAVRPYTEEVPRAHGGITYTETCLDCGASRPVNSNAGAREVGVWRREETS